jgi:hypothetical protein
VTVLQEIHARLETAAYKVTDNFCYSCYKVVEGEYCPDCHSDDFMRHLAGVGVEYGTEWVIEHLIKNRCEEVDGEEMFDQMLDECYPEISIGCSTWTPSHVLSELDPVAYRIGVSEHLSSLAEDGELYEYSGDYYRPEDIEEMLDDIEAE